MNEREKNEYDFIVVCYCLLFRSIEFQPEKKKREKLKYQLGVHFMRSYKLEKGKYGAKH